MRHSLIAITLSVFLLSCTRVRSDSDIPGRYELVYAGGDLVLDVRADHTYLETARAAKSLDRRVAGAGKLLPGWVSFDALIIPSEVIPEGGRIGPTLSQTPATPNWCLPAVRILGGTRLEVNPDRDLAFKAVAAK
jgi:hypothetical protein